MTQYKYNNTYLNKKIETYNRIISEWQEADFPKITKTSYSFDGGSCDIQLHLDRDIDKSFIPAVFLVLFKDYLMSAPLMLDEILGFSWLESPNQISFWYGRLENMEIDTYLSDPEE